MQFECLQLEKGSQGLYALTLNRPRVLNAFNSVMTKELISALDLIGEDPDSRAILIRGSGNNFSAGADIKDRPENVSWDSPEGRRASANYMDLCDRMCDRIWDYPLPIVAEVSGYCLGLGLVFALKCDIRIVSEDAKLGFPEVKHGVFAGQGGTQFIPKYLGIGKAKLLTLTGRIIDGQTAYSMGLADVITTSSKLKEQSLSVANEIIGNAPLPVRFTKWLINKSLEVSPSYGAYLEKLKNDEIQESSDWVEGFKAFAEKRKPNYKGK
jgi:enoyl-CoA hydratase/carnithine racemase